MPFPLTLARFNRRVTNPVVGRWAADRAPLAIVVHTGRASGNRYETPVLAFRSGEQVTFALTYGSDVDWVRNVIAAGGCELVRSGERLPLVGPRLLGSVEGLERMPAPVRRVLGLLRVDEFLESTVDGGTVT